MYLKREGRIAYRSLKHRDKKQAIDQAERLAAKRREGAEAVATGTVTLERVFRLYRAHQTPKKAPATQVEDERRIELFTNAWGKGKSPYAVNLAQWDTLITARRTGAIDSHGRVVKPEHRVPVRDGTVFADLSWLQTVCAWAARWRTGEDGTYLLRENPVRGFDAPRERNPRRPLATEARFQKILAVAPRLRIAVHWGEKPESVPTYLPSLLILANGTGRRISAICSLKFADLRPSLGPHGSIRWPADTDKMGLESVVPVTREVREVLDRIQRERPGMGAAPLFPRPQESGRADPLRVGVQLAPGSREARRVAETRRVALACVQEKVGDRAEGASPTSTSRLREDGRARVRSSSSISAPTRPRCTASFQRGRSSSRSWARPNRWLLRGPFSLTHEP